MMFVWIPVAALMMCYSQQSDALKTLDTLSDWRSSRGEWIIAGAVRTGSDLSRLIAEPGDGILVNGPAGKTSDLLSVMEHGDAEVRLEFIVPKGSNSGVYFQGRYEVQVFDSYGVKVPTFTDCGGIYQRWDEKAQRGYEGRAPSRNASKAPGEWQSFEVIFRAPRFDSDGRKVRNALFESVRHNGVLIHEQVEVTGPTRAATYQDEKPLGPLMLQGDHGPVAYRAIRIRSLEQTPARE